MVLVNVRHKIQELKSIYTGYDIFLAKNTKNIVYMCEFINYFYDIFLTKIKEKSSKQDKITTARLSILFPFL